MAYTLRMSALPLMGAALLVTSCAAGEPPSNDVEPGASSPVAKLAPLISADTIDDEERHDIGVSVPLGEEHLAEGVEMPPGCLSGPIPIYVDAEAQFDETDLLYMCPAEPAEDRIFRPSQQLLGTQNGTTVHYLPGEAGAGVEVHHLHCEDPEGLAAKAAHNGGAQPAGWPQEWDGTGDMPDPYCHRDYLEVGEWEHLQAFSSVWEGTETSTLGDYGQPQAEIDRFLWQQSQARADWTP